jgi:hypothetical protein
MLIFIICPVDDPIVWRVNSRDIFQFNFTTKDEAGPVFCPIFAKKKNSLIRVYTTESMINENYFYFYYYMSAQLSKRPTLWTPTRMMKLFQTFPGIGYFLIVYSQTRKIKV